MGDLIVIWPIAFFVLIGVSYAVYYVLAGIGTGLMRLGAGDKAPSYFDTPRHKKVRKWIFLVGLICASIDGFMSVASNDLSVYCLAIFGLYLVFAILSAWVSYAGVISESSK